MWGGSPGHRGGPVWVFQASTDSQHPSPDVWANVPSDNTSPQPFHLPAEAPDITEQWQAAPNMSHLNAWTTETMLENEWLSFFQIAGFSRWCWEAGDVESGPTWDCRLKGWTCCRPQAQSSPSRLCGCWCWIGAFPHWNASDRERGCY